MSIRKKQETDGKKLKLKKETLRELTASELARANGGLQTNIAATRYCR